MRHVALTTVALAAAVAIVACEQQVADQNPTAPEVDLSFAKQIGGQCDAARASLINTQITDYWNRPARDSAQARFALVTAVCSSDIATARSRMLDYIQWTIDNRLVNVRNGTDANLLINWNTVFPYVGYNGGDQPSNVPTTIFTADGAAKVVDGNQTGELTAANAALTMYAQNVTGDPRDHLLVIYPIGASCLTGTNLKQSGPCFEFASFPHVAGHFDPKAKLGICQPVHEGEAIPLKVPSLGHLDPLTRIVSDPQTYPTFCADLASSTPAGSWNNLGGALTRLAWYAKKAVTPASVYAGHGGLGGLGGGFSPHGAVDLEVFQADFDGNTIGQPPGSTGTGTWFQQVTPPGSILVQSSLGTYTGPLVVLNQGGGNCKNCGGLLLQGNLFTAGSPATEGIYEVKFTALQSASNMKEALFVLRDASGRDIARVTYAVRNNVNLIMYNNTSKNNNNTFLKNWVQNAADQFTITVDLDAKTTTISVNGGAASTPVGFVNGSAANLATISADFRGIDSGTMGWDEISVTRLPDLN